MARRSRAPVKGSWVLEILVNPARGKSTTDRPRLPIAILLWPDSWCRSHNLSRASETLDDSSSFLISPSDLLKVTTVRLASIKNSTVPNSTRNTAVSGGLLLERSNATFPQISRKRRTVEASSTSRFLARTVPISPATTVRDRTGMVPFSRAAEGIPRTISGATYR